MRTQGTLMRTQGTGTGRRWHNTAAWALGCIALSGVFACTYEYDDFRFRADAGAEQPREMPDERQPTASQADGDSNDPPAGGALAADDSPSSGGSSANDAGAVSQ
jgi:hypothetical protein